MKLGEKIKYLRKSKGISQEELATMSREINHMLHFFIKSSFLPIDIL